jgi:hypothetical protein
VVLAKKQQNIAPKYGLGTPFEPKSPKKGTEPVLWRKKIAFSCSETIISVLREL